MLKYMLLVAEDEYEHLFFQNAIDNLNRGFRLLSAYNGKTGLRIFRKVKPVSVFINFQLNDMNGLLCLNRMKSLKGADNIPVYIYSNDKNGHLARNAIASGAAGCLATNDAVNGLKACLYKTLAEQDRALSMAAK